MLPITIANGRDEIALFALLKARSGEVDGKVNAVVAEIIARVKSRGDDAVRDYAMQFDKACPAVFEVSQAEIDQAMQNCDTAFLDALKRAAERVRVFHENQKRQSWFTTDDGGVLMGQRVRPLARVGVYVPGGTAVYPSSVLMNVIPAKVAGVGEIIMVTPPGGGKANPNIIAAAHIAGANRIFLMGGAQAVAALAFGTRSVPKVDKIVGPGNIFVATAKKQLYGEVDIDSIAGPSEILVIADESANPEFLAADLLSQAEHDRLASAILLATSEDIAKRTREALLRQLETLPRADIAKESLERFGALIVCENMTQAIVYANEFAPEHLELCVQEPMQYLGAIDNAGSVFVGHFTPESVGDYYAGANHVLPTGGTARFFSPLSVDDYVKKIQFISYTKTALSAAAQDIICLAENEGLTAHANAVRVRF